MTRTSSTSPDGLAEELTTALARVENFRVVSRHSTRQYGKGSHDVRDIGQELAVRFILEGKVQRSAKSVRVTAQLTDTTDGVQVWADSYSRQLKADDLFRIQDEIVTQVIAKVADTYGVIPRLLEKETRGKRTSDLEAYDSLLRFYHYQANLGIDQYDHALKGLLQAVDRDPEYGPGLAALAELMCDQPDAAATMSHSIVWTRLTTMRAVRSPSIPSASRRISRWHSCSFSAAIAMNACNPPTESSSSIRTCPITQGSRDG